MGRKANRAMRSKQAVLLAVLSTLSMGADKRGCCEGATLLAMASDAERFTPGAVLTFSPAGPFQLAPAFLDPDAYAAFVKDCPNGPTAALKRSLKHFVGIRPTE